MKWDVTYLYATYDDFKSAEKEAMALVDSIKSFEGQLGIEEKFREYYDLIIKLTGEYEKLYLYAECRQDVDLKNTKAVSDLQEVMYFFMKLGENTAFERSEVLSLGKDYCMSVIEKYDELKQFKYYFENIFRQTEHTPSKEVQSVIACYEALSNSVSSTYNSLSAGDLKEHIVKLDNGKEVNVADSNWAKLISDSASVEEKKRIFDAQFSRFEANKNTYASIYNSILQSDIALAKARKFGSALEMHLYANNIPVSLYQNLIETAHKAVPEVKRYIDIRKKCLGLETYHTYDRFSDLAKSDSTKEYSYQEALDIFYKSIEKFTPEFIENAHEATKEGYVDVLPSNGKRSGAYSNSTPNVHPVILLNHNGSLDSVFTLAHEAGHSTHTLFSEQAQPVMTQSYTIFVAEIASTFNEHNLLDYLLTSGTLSKAEKINLIQQAIDSIMSTFLRQVLFAEYEYIAHTKAENGEPITEEVLSNIMIDLYEKYYGIDIKEETYKQYVWAYVSHFFRSPYYVYQYSTSFAASLAIYQNVKDGVPGAFDRYIDLLKSGGSDYPINIVKKAGVDFTRIESLESVNVRFKELIDELEALINE